MSFYSVKGKKKKKKKNCKHYCVTPKLLFYYSNKFIEISLV